MPSHTKEEMMERLLIWSFLNASIPVTAILFTTYISYITTQKIDLITITKPFVGGDNFLICATLCITLFFDIKEATTSLKLGTRWRFASYVYLSFFAVNLCLFVCFKIFSLTSQTTDTAFNAIVAESNNQGATTSLLVLVAIFFTGLVAKIIISHKEIEKLYQEREQQ